MSEAFAWSALLLGITFFIAGGIGLLRLPDALCRLHALTKVDNVGLGLCLLGASLVAGTVSFAAKALLIWFFVLIGSAAAGHVIAAYVKAETDE